MIYKKSKGRIYWLINEYVAGRIDSKSFEKEYIECYNLHLDEQLLEVEENVFSHLNMIASRFSPFDEDLKNYPEVYYSEQELKAAAIKAKSDLKKYFDNFEKSMTNDSIKY